MKNRKLTIAFALTAALVSCNKQEMQVGGSMCLEVETVGMESVTRSTPLNDLATFKTKVDSFNVFVYDGNTLVSTAPTSAKKSGESYQMNKDYYWNPSKTLDIYAVAPKYASGPYSGTPSVTPASNKLTFTYNLASSTAPSAMTDIMIAHYNGNGNSTGKATLKFYHALTALQFYTGNLIDMTINSVTLENIYSNGTCNATFSAEVPTVLWPSPGSETAYTYTLSTAVTHTYGGSQQAIAAGENTFMIIPQTGHSDAKLKLGVKIGGSDATIYCSLKDITWAPGKLYKYAVNYTKEGMMTINSIDVVAWESQPEQSLDLDKVTP